MTRVGSREWAWSIAASAFSKDILGGRPGLVRLRWEFGRCNVREVRDME